MISDYLTHVQVSKISKTVIFEKYIMKCLGMKLMSKICTVIMKYVQ